MNESQVGNEDVHTLYIAGIGRSGSTLLCRTLGSMRGYVGTGEIMRILGRGLLNGDLCSCGAPVPSCYLWVKVREEMERLRPRRDLARLERTGRRVTEGWDMVPYLLLPGRASGLELRLGEYRDFLSDLFRAIRTVTGARVVVDASKNPIFAKLLMETPGINLSLLHLVRDSRGYAHSLSRKRERPGTNGRSEHFGRYGALASSVAWGASHVMIEMLKRQVPRSVQVRYEDFAAQPERTVRAILRGLSLPGGSGSPLPVNGTSVELNGDHLIASNPNRALRGKVSLRVDRAWQEEMGRLRRWLVTGMTRPLLRRYEYLSLNGAARPAPVVGRPIRVREPRT